MSLADELLADLEEIAEEGEEIETNNDEDDNIEEVEDISMDIDTRVDSIKCIAKLRHSKEVHVKHSQEEVHTMLIITGLHNYQSIIRKLTQVKLIMIVQIVLSFQIKHKYAHYSVCSCLLKWELFAPSFL